MAIQKQEEIVEDGGKHHRQMGMELRSRPFRPPLGSHRWILMTIFPLLDMDTGFVVRLFTLFPDGRGINK
ncbi:hypothetical protein L243_37260 [Salmonella enterica subsp. enterica serovar Worthington str. BCH-3008]|nr:hypothetical protein L243_37260 [Salmonella enterica subsp. enterica serovar Worthington str. BCH-3008]